MGKILKMLFVFRYKLNFGKSDVSMFPAISFFVKNENGDVEKRWRKNPR